MVPDGAHSVATYSVRDIEDLVRGLSAEQRAQLAWTPKSFRDAVNVLLTRPFSQDSLKEAAGIAVPAYMALWPTVVRAIQQADLAALAAAMEEKLAGQIALAREFIGDDVLAADAAEWALRSLASIGPFAVALAPEIQTQVEQINWKEALSAPPVAAFICAVLLLAAVLDAAERREHLERARELSLLALIFTQHATAGTPAKPFSNESGAERAARVDRYAGHVRRHVSDELWQGIERSRMGDLR